MMTNKTKTDYKTGQDWTMTASLLHIHWQSYTSTGSGGRGKSDNEPVVDEQYSGIKGSIPFTSMDATTLLPPRDALHD